MVNTNSRTIIKGNFWFLLILFLYWVAWLIFNQFHSVPFASIETDGFEQVAQAQTIFSNQFVHSAVHPEGYPFAIWLLARIIPNWFLAAKLVSGLAGFVFLVSTYKTAELIFNTQTALLVSLVLLVNFFFIAYSNLVMADMQAVALAQVSIYLFLTAPIRWSWKSFGSGLALGLAAFTRIVYLPIGMLPVISVLLDILKRRPVQVRRSLGMVVGLMLGIAPILILNWLSFGKLWADENFRTVAQQVYGADWNAFNSLTETILYNPAVFFYTYFHRLLYDRLLLAGHAMAYVLFFGFAGLVLMFVRDQSTDGWEQRILWAASAGLYYLIVPLNNEQLRFLLFILPIMVTGSIYLFQEFFSHNQRWLSIAVGILILSNLGLYPPNISRFLAERGTEFERAGEIINRTADSNAVTLVSQPQIGYLTRHKYVHFRDAAFQDNLGAMVDAYNLQYIIADERYGAGHYPLLKDLVDPTKMPPQITWLKLLYHENGFPRIAVYEIVKPVR